MPAGIVGWHQYKHHQIAASSFAGYCLLAGGIASNISGGWPCRITWLMKICMAARAGVRWHDAPHRAPILPGQCSPPWRTPPLIAGRRGMLAGAQHGHYAPSRRYIGLSKFRLSARCCAVRQ